MKPEVGIKTGVVFDDRFFDHQTDEGCPENTARMAVLKKRLQRPEIQKLFVLVAPEMAKDEAILMVHAKAYLEKIKATASHQGTIIGGDISLCNASFDVAKLAVGGLLNLIRSVVEGRLLNGFVMARPPGHHAERSRAMGFCLFNNVAIGAMFARKVFGLKRVLIADWDVHHGNGIQHMFEKDPDLLFFSTHQHPHYPGTGMFTETGKGPGEGRTINIPLPGGFGDNEYVALYKTILEPVAKEFMPELILVCAGFDIHKDDPLGAMKVTPQGFAGLARVMLDMADACSSGKVVFCLEGGYNPDALAESVEAILREMAGKTHADTKKIAAGADRKKLDRVVSKCIHVHHRYWNALNL